MKSLTAEQMQNSLAKIQAILQNDHFVYTSGKHGSAYVNKDAIYPHTELTSQLCFTLAEHFAHQDIDVVVSPVIGGVILSQWVAYHLTQITSREVLGVYAEKSEDTFVLKRGYDELVRNKNVLVVEDILNTGISVQRLIQTLQNFDTNVVGVGALCNRGGVTAEQLEVPQLHSLMNINLQAWEASDCPLCQKGTPINQKIGKGRKK